MTEAKTKDRVLTNEEKELITEINGENGLYSVNYIEMWLNRRDNVFVNAPSALSAMDVNGYYAAIRAMIRSRDRG